MAAVRALGSIGPAAGPAVPVLVSIQEDRDLMDAAIDEFTKVSMSHGAEGNGDKPTGMAGAQDLLLLVTERRELSRAAAEALRKIQGTSP
jgi:hypothetical protein